MNKFIIIWACIFPVMLNISIADFNCYQEYANETTCYNPTSFEYVCYGTGAGWDTEDTCEQTYDADYTTGGMREVPFVGERAGFLDFNFSKPPGATEYTKIKMRDTSTLNYNNFTNNDCFDTFNDKLSFFIALDPAVYGTLVQIRLACYNSTGEDEVIRESTYTKLIEIAINWTIRPGFYDTVKNYSSPSPVQLGSNSSLKLNLSDSYIYANASNYSLYKGIIDNTFIAINETPTITEVYNLSGKFSVDHNASEGYDGNYTTFSHLNTTCVLTTSGNDSYANIYENYTLSPNIHFKNITLKVRKSTGIIEAYTNITACYNYSNDQYLLIHSQPSPLSEVNISLPGDCIDENQNISILNYLYTGGSCRSTHAEGYTETLSYYESSLLINIYNRTYITNGDLSNESEVYSSDNYLFNESGEYYYVFNITDTVNEVSTYDSYQINITDNKYVSPDGYIQTLPKMSNTSFNITINSNNVNMTWNVSYNLSLSGNITILNANTLINVTGNTSHEINVRVSENSSNTTFYSILNITRQLDNYSELIYLNITVSDLAGNIYLENDGNYGVITTSTSTLIKNFIINNTGNRILENITCYLNEDFIGKGFWSFNTIETLTVNTTSNISLTILNPTVSTYTGDLNCYGLSTDSADLDYLEPDNSPTISITVTQGTAPTVSAGGSGGGDDSKIQPIFDVSSKNSKSLIYFQTENTNITNLYELENLNNGPTQIRITCVSDIDYCQYVYIENDSITLPENKLIITNLNIINYLPVNYTNRTTEFTIRFIDYKSGQINIDNKVITTNQFSVTAIWGKFVTSYSIGGLNIPKAIPILMITAILSYLTYFISRKNKSADILGYFSSIFWIIITAILIP